MTRQPAASLDGHQESVGLKRETHTPLPLRPAQNRAATAHKGGSLRLPSGPATRVVSSLAIVLGVFLLFTLLFRNPAKRRAGALPTEAAEVLGVVQLTSKQQLHLVRLGSRLLLLNLAGGRVERVAEVADPHEVGQLIATCQQGQPNVVSGAVRDMLSRLDRPQTATAGGIHADRTALWEATHG